MKKTLASTTFIVLIVVSLLVSGCSSTPAVGGGQVIPPPDDAILEAYDPTLTQKLNQFGLELVGQLFDGKENMLLSPVSIATALAMTYNGAGTTTKEAMAAVLGVEDVDLSRFNENNLALLYLLQEAAPDVKLEVANSLWLRAGIPLDEAFEARNKEYYAAPVNELDFDHPEAAATINRWIHQRTGGLIDEMIEPPINPLTILFLINAIYFQGDWTIPFNEKNTHEAAFYLAGGDTKEVPFMERYGEFKYYEGAGLQGVRLPYGQEERLAMYVFLPEDTGKFVDLVRDWDSSSWEEMRGAFRQGEGTVSIPRFTLEYEESLNDVLKELGMEIAFDPYQADFFDMVAWDEEPRLFISEVKHKSFLEVTEKGTEAAAATSVEIRVESAPPNPFSLKANRPFFFLVHDELTDAVLFVGAVMDPQAE